jgi:hypothetical protein
VNDWVAFMLFGMVVAGCIAWYIRARSRRDSSWSMREVNQMIEGRRDAAGPYDGKDSVAWGPSLGDGAVSIMPPDASNSCN